VDELVALEIFVVFINVLLDLAILVRQHLRLLAIIFMLIHQPDGVLYFGLVQLLELSFSPGINQFPVASLQLPQFDPGEEQVFKPVSLPDLVSNKPDV